MKKRLLLIASVFSLGIFSSYGQVTDLGNPISWNEKVEGAKNVPTMTMPTFDVAPMLVADSINNATKAAPYRFGYEHNVNYNLSNSGAFTVLPNGDRIWRIKLESVGALSINLVFNDFFLSPGSHVKLYSFDKTHYQGAYTSANNNQNAQLGTDIMPGENMIVELYEPQSEIGVSRLMIGMVVHGYKDVNSYVTQKVNESGGCNLDVICPQGTPWDNNIRSVARILNGGGLCSGTLLNNTANDGTPYFLTANHCGPQNMGAGVFKFNYDSPTCGSQAASNSTDPGTNDIINGSIFRARNPDTDFGLIELNSVPPAAYGVFYAGWDNSGTTPTNTIGIHHPAGDVKKISFDDDSPTITSYSSNVVPGDGSMWRVITWDQNTTTEGGSSGSCLFDPQGRVIGQLYGGGAACGNTLSDWYGRVSESWQGPTNAEELQFWLDPSNSSTVLDGYDPNTPTVALDARIQSISAPTGTICNDSIYPVVTISNSGSTTLTSATINYDVDGGTNMTFNWTGSLATNANEVINLPGFATTNGAHTFNASTSNPNGSTDENTANDANSSTFTTLINGQSVDIYLNTDCWGAETSWEIQDDLGGVLYSGTGYGNETTYLENVCLEPGCYNFVIEDTYGDGMYGSQYGSCTTNGAYYIVQFGYLIDSIQAVNSDFGTQEINSFCVKSLLANFTIDNDSICEGGSVQFTDAVIEGPATSWDWTFAGGTPATSSDQNPSVTYSTPGVYDVIMRAYDALSGDTLSVTSLITVLANPVIASPVTTDVTCNGGSDGSIDVTVSSGSPAYSYLWDNSATTEDISGLVAGNYNLTVTDDEGCTATTTATITEPTALVASITSSPSPSCNGDTDGSIDLEVTGGITTYTYAWDNGAGTSEDPSGLSSGTYNVTVTDANGCTDNTSATLINPTTVSITLNSSTNSSCNGSNGGQIDVNVSGGTPTYTYLWSNGSTSEDLVNVVAGSYSLTVTDANGCTGTFSTTITEPTAISANASSTNETCGNSNGSASVSPSGGTPGFTYSWSTGATTPTINGLAAGTYSLIITDANGCSLTESITITNSGGPSITISSSSNPTCNGSADGTATAVATGGTSPYTYSWSTSATTATETGLTAGTYTVTATDANGCSSSTSVTLIDPTSISANATTTNATCGASNGTATVTPTGGTGAYTYSWPSGSTTATETGLATGNYNVVITDANGCILTESIAISSTGGPIISLVSQSNVNCNGGNDGSAEVSVSGGTSPYTYSWTSGSTTTTSTGLSAGTETVTVTDDAGCTSNFNVTITEQTAISVTSTTTQETCGNSNGSATVSVSGGAGGYNYSWSTGGNTATETGLTAGNYSVTITDANGCIITENVTVTSSGGPTASISAQTNTTCNGSSNGSATVSATSGTSPYTYSWSSGGNGTTETGLSAGTYTVMVTDNNGCSTTASVTITEPQALIASIVTVTDLSCFNAGDGAINLEVAGGTSPYTYSWSNASTIQDLSGLDAGTYSVTVTDDNGCTTTTTATVNEPAQIQASINSVTNIICNGNANGAIDVSITGGTPTFIYNWDNGASTEDISGLDGGTYVLTIIDANGCTDNISATVTEPNPLTATITTTNSNCGANDGTATVVATGGTPNYSYSWSTGGAGTTESGLSAGSISVVVTDANGCVYTATNTIADNGGITVSTTTTDVLCNGGNDGTATAAVVGGSAPFTYSWDNGGTSSQENNLSAGTYLVTVTDDNGCTSTADAIVNEPTAITITETSTDEISGGDGSIDITVTGGTAPYAYSWDNGESTEDISGLNGGVYVVTVTDANGCTQILTVLVDSQVSLVEVEKLSTNLFPNPTAGSVTIQLNMSNVEISVSNAIGQKVIQNFKSNDSTVSIELSQFGSGVYFVHFAAENGNKITKRVVVRP